MRETRINALWKTLALACAVWLAACSNSDEPSRRVPAFADLDTDGDGFLSRQETQRVPELADIFETADADGNGRLSVAEYSRATIEGTTVSPESANPD